MELYIQTSYELAETVTKRYSTSFSLSSRLFSSDIRPHIYAIYGLVRVADEIVDSYQGDDAAKQLDALRDEVHRACSSGHSANPIVHAYAQTARAFGIDRALIDPFFDSMAMDLKPTPFDQERYERYIYGSAEVIGLMCLKVFVAGDEHAYAMLSDGARALGAGYQKVNFLRDLRADNEDLGRMYFPGVTFATFSKTDKQAIITDIEHDFALARQSLPGLPRGARRAVTASLYYYDALLEKLRKTPAQQIAQARVRVPDWYKLALLARAGVGL